MEYVRSYGYLNDLRYAENYISFRMGTKSRQKILQELSGKGVDRATALAAWEAAAEVEQPDELAVLRATVQKKCQPDSALDEKAMRRLQGFLLRRGFSYGDHFPRTGWDAHYLWEKFLFVRMRVLNLLFLWALGNVMKLDEI